MTVKDQEAGMGFARRRTGRDGRPRYTAYYQDLRGRETSAGMFPTKREADKAWQRAEAKVAEGRHILDWFGDMRMIDILPSHIREWVSDLKEQGLSPASIRLNKSILSAVFTTALNDQVTVLRVKRLRLLQPPGHGQPRRRRGQPQFHPTGDRFLVKEYPKDRQYRGFRLSPQVIDRVKTWVADHGLAADDLIFTTHRRPPRDKPVPSLQMTWG